MLLTLENLVVAIHTVFPLLPALCIIVQHSLSGLSNCNALCCLWGTNRIVCVWCRLIVVCKESVRLVFTVGHQMDERKLRAPYTLHSLVRMASFCFRQPASSALQSSPVFIDVLYASIACLFCYGFLHKARDTVGVPTNSAILRCRCSYTLCFGNIDYWGR